LQSAKIGNFSLFCLFTFVFCLASQD